MRPICIFIRGLPGSGKTTFAEKLSPLINATVVEPEYIDKLGKEFVKFSSEFESLRTKKIVYRFNLNQTISLLKQGKNVIWAQPWRNAEKLDITISNVLKRAHCDIYILELEENPSTLWERKRLRFLTREKYLRYINKMQPVNKNYKFLRLDMRKSTKYTIETVLKFIKYPICSKNLNKV